MNHHLTTPNGAATNVGRVRIRGGIDCVVCCVALGKHGSDKGKRDESKNG
jgi:hypothetical protein